MRKEKLSSSSSLGAGAVQLTLSKVISLAVSMLTTALLSYFRYDSLARQLESIFQELTEG